MPQQNETSDSNLAQILKCDHQKYTPGGMQTHKELLQVKEECQSDYIKGVECFY